VRGSYNNLGQCIAGVVKQGGVCKLYTGFLASVAVSGPSSAVFIACYECSKNAIEKVAATFPPPLASIQNIAPILAAAFGNLAASTVRVPPEVIKQRVQAGLYRCVSSNVFVNMYLYIQRFLLSVTSNGYLFMIHFMNVHQQSST
jgi:solute carrier family 25 S-adenosylmethionine transporter 26